MNLNLFSGYARQTRALIMPLVLLWITLCLTPSLAEELITDFHADIQIEENGDLIVTETISVVVEGKEIRRGIFRDFPRSFRGKDGYLKRVSFDIISIKRNGESEPYTTSYYNGDSRVQIGEEDVIIDRGRHTYTLTYRTDRQIRQFDTNDEIYWNVTGNGWSFPIENAGAEITPPDGGTFEKLDVFTGYVGEIRKDARATLADGGRKAVFETTAPLDPGEGLTVVAALPKDVVLPPDSNQRFWWYMRDYGHLVIGALTLAFVFFYYLLVWFFSGRDPDGGTVIPRWDLPEGVSPALAGYVSKFESNRGKEGLSAAILSLAVKGHVTMENIEETPVLIPTPGKTSDELPTGEAAIFGIVSAREDFPISKGNAKSVAKLNEKFNQAIASEHRGLFYKHNTGWIILGIFLSLAGVVLSGLFNITSIFILLVGLVISLITCALLVPLYFLANTSINSTNPAGKTLGLFVAGVLAGLLLYGLAWLMQALVAESQTPGVVLFVALIVGIIAVNAWFFTIIGAPTPLGAHLMSAIKGLQLYLNVAEKDRMNLAGAPSMSPRHFETLLPYAVALGLEKPWSETFQKWLRSAHVTQSGEADYRPVWVRGTLFDSFHSDNRFDGIGQSIAGSIVSSIPTTSSSS
ncbi:MAG: DUF2207 domain-containing protein, partial [Stappiaceae bacterium]